MSRNFELLKQLEIDAGAPDSTPLPVKDGPVRSEISQSDGGDEMIRLVKSVFLSRAGRTLRHVVFCGADNEAGSSSVCAAAGLALSASTSHTVCLVDANVRSPHFSTLFGVDSALPRFIDSDGVREQCVQIGTNLWLAPADMFADDSGALISGDALEHVIAQLKDMFGYLFVDAPGASINSDAAILGQRADAAILVVEANSTRRLAARKAKEALDAAGVRLLGTILNNRTFAIPEALYRKL